MQSKFSSFLNVHFTPGPALSLALVCAVGTAFAQPSVFPDNKFWVTDGPVNALLATNGAVYLGGNFSYVGPRTGPAGVFNAADGSFVGAPPLVNGPLRAVVPDGRGGWFIGGAFTRVGDSPKTNLARLNANLTLDAGWDAAVQGSTINALAIKDGVLFIGGSFQRLGGKVFNSLAGLDTGTAQVVWDPQLSGTVNAMRIGGSLIYVGGNFYTVGASNRQNLAAIRLDTSRATDWAPQPDQQVWALEVSGNNVYAGGQFTVAGTKPRNRLVALDATTGVATSWNPNPNGLVRAIALSGSSLYVAGDFTTIGGQNRRSFAAVNTGNGAAQALNLDIQPVNASAGQVRTILISGNSMYLGGGLTNALGELHRLVLGMDLPSGQVLPVPPASEFNGSAGAPFGANALAMADGKVFVGGEFYSIGGVPRQNAAALSLASGAPTEWAPEVAGPVLAMTGDGDRMFVGGSFTNVNGELVRGLASVDGITGVLTPGFRFLGSNGVGGIVTVSAMGMTSNRLYVGGSFVEVAGQPRRLLAALDKSTGNLTTAFDAKLGGGYSGVNALLMAGTNLYVAGDFSTVGGQPVPRLTAVAASDGALRNWTPTPNQLVTALAANGENLYVGGQFNQISGVALKNFAAFSLADLSLQGVDASLAQFSGGVSALAATPYTLYVGGQFDAIGGEFRLNLASLTAFNASANEWDPAADVAPSVITLTDEYAIVGGAQRWLGRSPTNRIGGFVSVFPRGPRFTKASLASGALKMETTTGDRYEAVLQSAPTPQSAVWTSIATNDFPGFSWSVDAPATEARQFFRVIAR